MVKSAATIYIMLIVIFAWLSWLSYTEARHAHALAVRVENDWRTGFLIGCRRANATRYGIRRFIGDISAAQIGAGHTTSGRLRLHEFTQRYFRDAPCRTQLAQAQQARHR